VLGVDDFASMREVVTRRYRRLLESQDPQENDAAAVLASSQAESSLSAHDSSRAENAKKSPRALALASKPSKEPKTLPSLILVDGGLGQLHAAAEALESLGLTSQPLASIAKREEVIYLYGNEDEPVVLDRRSPVLHLVQLIRDESHRFAVGYHRQRRAMRDRDSELLNIPGVGAQTRQRLLSHFGSLRDVQQATAESLASVVPRKTAEAIWQHFHLTQPA
jgi:excinuclease ABC subunit C